MDAMTSHSDPRARGALLRARRAQLDPRECGLPETDSARRVAGPRREEVAQVAAISVDYYTRLEQGRVRASAPVLTTLARALRLDDDQRHYVYELAGRTDARPRHRRPAQRTRPAMRRLLDQLTHTPALFTDPRSAGCTRMGHMTPATPSPLCAWRPWPTPTTSPASSAN